MAAETGPQTLECMQIKRELQRVERGGATDSIESRERIEDIVTPGALRSEPRRVVEELTRKTVVVTDQLRRAFGASGQQLPPETGSS